MLSEHKHKVAFLLHTFGSRTRKHFHAHLWHHLTVLPKHCGSNLACSKGNFNGAERANCKYPNSVIWAEWQGAARTCLSSTDEIRQTTSCPNCPWLSVSCSLSFITGWYMQAERARESISIKASAFSALTPRSYVFTNAPAVCFRMNKKGTP